MICMIEKIRIKIATGISTGKTATKNCSPDMPNVSFLVNSHEEFENMLCVDNSMYFLQKCNTWISFFSEVRTISSHGKEGAFAQYVYTNYK